MFRHFLFFLFAIVFVIFKHVSSERKFSMQEQITRKLLDEKVYKKQERPDEGNTTEVMVYMMILAIDSVDVRQMQYSIDVYLRQVWVDKRLAWHNIKEFKKLTTNIVSPALKENIWLPDLFFRNGKRGYIHNMTTPNYLMRLQPNGEVLYSQKITMIFSCQMALQAFPMDTQRCEINIGSYGYTLEELRFYWRENNTVVVNKELKIPEFYTPEYIKTVDCSNESSTSTGNYTCLKAYIEFKRQVGSYLASVYIPSMLIIMVSWMNFWISLDAVAAPARVSLSLLSLLGIVNQAISIAASLPRVSYIKAIDIWLIASIIFVIAALVEYAIAIAVAKQQKSVSWHDNVIKLVREEINQLHTNFTNSKQSHMDQKFISNNRVGVLGPPLPVKPIENLPPGAEMLFSNKPNQNEILLKQLNHRDNASKFALKPNPTKPKSSTNESMVDNFSRFLFPACFVLFNTFYWFYYSILIQYYNK